MGSILIEIKGQPAISTKYRSHWTQWFRLLVRPVGGRASSQPRRTRPLFDRITTVLQQPNLNYSLYLDVTIGRGKIFVGKIPTLSMPKNGLLGRFPTNNWEVELVAVSVCRNDQFV